MEFSSTFLLDLRHYTILNLFVFKTSYEGHRNAGCCCSFTMWLLALSLLLLIGPSTFLDVGVVHGDDAGPTVVPLPANTTEDLNATEIICANITCKDPPPDETCVQRSALTIAATAAYGEKRICCPLWSCTLSNGTTSLHYGMTAKGLKLVNDDLDLIEPEAEEGKNETCAGIVCLPGSPSATNCRRSSAPDISQGLMNVRTECCPLWTCTFPSNGSLYYVHSGVTTLSHYWASSIKKFDVAFMTADADPLASLPVLSTTETPKGMLEKKSTDNTSELLMQVFTREMEITDLEGVREDGWCDGVTCYPPRSPSCVPTPDTDNKLSDLLGLRKPCCPLYACKSNTDRFLLFSFGMFYSENVTTTTVDTSMFSVTPVPMLYMLGSSTALTVPPVTALVTTTEAPKTSTTEILLTTTASPESTTTSSKTTAGGTDESTTTKRSVSIDDYEEEESEELKLEMSTNPADTCSPMKCYPIPDREKCVPSPPSDCSLRLIMASALACCPSYKCSYASGPIFQFGITNGVTHTVIAAPMNETSDNKPAICPTSSSSGGEVRKIEFTDDCDSVKCLRPRGIRLGDCEKLPEGGGVPRPLREAGVSHSCCGVWKCSSNAGYKEIYQFGVVFHDNTAYIPFYFDGEEKVRKSLPTEITDLESSRATPSTCPDVNCGPPFPGAACKPADGSVTRRIKASLHRKTLCCPIWECTQTDSVIYIYGHMFSSNHANVPFKSIFSSKFFSIAKEEDYKFDLYVEEKKTTTTTTDAPAKKKTFEFSLIEEETTTSRHSLGVLQMSNKKKATKKTNNKKKNEEEETSASSSSSSSSSSEEEKDTNKKKKKKSRKGGAVMKQKNKQQVSVVVN